MSDLLVLGYHALSERWPPSLAVRPDMLTRQLARLRSRGYRGACVSDALASPGSSRTVAVTFDDGYASMLRLAAPILARAGLPGTVYIPTDWPDRPDPMTWSGIEHWGESDHADELISLTWDEVRELSDAGWEIGAHSCSHPHLTQVDDTRLADELTISKARLEDELGRPCTSVAYPYGDADQRVAEAARAAGFANAVTLPRARDPLSSGDPWLSPRIPIHRADDRRRFAVKTAPLLRRVREAPAFARLASATQRG